MNINIKKIIFTVFFTITIIITLLLIVILFVLDGTKYDFQEHCKIEYMLDWASYTYKDKVRIEYTRMGGEENCTLSVRRDTWDSSYTILSGKFEKVGWHDDVLYILSNYKYYSFDIDSYIYPQKNNGNPPDYELCEYSYSEFINSFSDYNDYHWFVP